MKQECQENISRNLIASRVAFEGDETATVMGRCPVVFEAWILTICECVGDDEV